MDNVKYRIREEKIITEDKCYIKFYPELIILEDGDTKEAMREHRMDDFRGMGITMLLFLILLFLKMFDKIF